MFTQQLLIQSVRSLCSKFKKKSAQLRGLHNMSQFLQHEVKEIEISVPWGKVAGE